jgi:outer membrane autotransporter protein
MQFGAANSGPLSLSTSYQPAMRIFAAGAANPTITFLYKTISGSGVLRVDNVSVVMVDDGQGNNIAAASQTVAVQASRDFMDRLYDRFGRVGSPIQSASVRETILASSDGSAYVNAGGKYRAFMSVFGSDAQWDHADTRADRKGVSAGFEFTIGHGIDLGAAFAFSETDFDTTSTFTRNRGEAEEFLGAIYGHWSARSLPMYVTAILGYGDSTNDFRRTSLVGLGSVFARDVDATQWFGGAEIGWDWNMASRLTLTPYARIDTANIDQDGYSETPVLGALLVPAVVAGRDVDATRSIVGVRAAYDLDVGKRGAKLGGKVGWAHEFDDDRFVTFTETTGPVTFAGSASAATPSEDSVVAGASVEVALDDRASFYAGYNGDFASDQEIHAGEVGLRVTW